MARLMLSCGMFSALAARIAVRSRGLPSGSPPPRAAMEISLIRRVKILPRLASAAPFLCLMDAHLEWPDISKLPENPGNIRGKIVPQATLVLSGTRTRAGQNEPCVGVWRPGPAAIVTDDGLDSKAGTFETLRHHADRQGAERQLEA